MFKVSINKIALASGLLVASFFIAISTPTLTSQAAPVALNSDQRSQLLSDWSAQVKAWQRASTVSASAVSGSMLPSQVAQLPNTGIALQPSDPVGVNVLKAVVLSGSVGFGLLLVKGQLWQFSNRQKKQ